jgi:formylglycine-generating enzyme required for sulfatase activity
MKSVRVLALIATLSAILALTTTCGEDEKPTPPVNTAPTACFTVSPDSGAVDTLFHFDASCSSEKKGPVSDLEVRWDWESDGEWDTGYSTTTTAEHQYAAAGTKTVTLEVKDAGGLTDQTTREVQVTCEGPASPGMVPVCAGTFTMGDGEAYWGQDERRVTLTHSFYLSQHEVTNQEYRDAVQWAYDQGYVTVAHAVLDSLDGSSVELLDVWWSEDCEISFSWGTFTVDPGKEDHPVIHVTWYGAARYCDWLSMQEGLPRAYEHSGDWSCNGGDPYGATGYRLPTDAEWEYAAQYDDERFYPWGNEEPDCTRANFAPDPAICVGWTTPVGSYPAAPVSLGLHDMAGNVREWCNDWFVVHLGSAAQTDPTGPSTGSGRILRGGAWNRNVDQMRCASRWNGLPYIAGHNYGFRYARSQ